MGVINEGRLLLVEDKASVMRRFGERRLVVTFEQPQAELPEPGRRFNATLSEDGRTLTYVEREGSAPAGELLRALYAQGLPIVGRGDAALAPGGRAHRDPPRPPASKAA